MVDARGARQQPERRQHSGVGWDDHGPEAERDRLPAGVERARAAERDQVESGRVEAAPDRHEAGRLDHRGIGDVEDRDRRVGRIDAEPIGEIADRSLRRSRVQRQAPTGDRRRTDPAEEDVRVRDGGLGPATSVAGGSRVRAGAPGTDPQEAAGVDPGDAPAAGADLDEVHDGPEDRQAAAVRDGRPGSGAGSDLEGRGLAGLAAGDHADLRGRSAHVESDGVAAADECRVVAGRREPAAGPDSMISTGRSSAIAAVARPPFDFISHRPVLAPRARSPSSIAAM